MTASRFFLLCLTSLLIVTGSAHSALAAFKLENSSWLLHGIDLGDFWIDPAEGAMADLHFENGEVTGSTGCNSFHGRYWQGGRDVGFSELGTTRMMCPDELMEQERIILEGLESATHFDFDEHILSIRTKEHGILLFRRLLEETDISNHKPQAGIIDHGGLHSYTSCKAARGDLLGVDGNQCAIAGKVHFASGQPAISLNRCSRYYDGCNSHMVADGALTGGTLMACPVEQDIPGCFVGDRRLLEAVGEIINLDRAAVEIVFDDIVEHFELGDEVNIDHFEKGDLVALSFLESPEGRDKIILTMHHHE